jgi:pSer/pThr/pTyr-binding forkhead associated (FHA) protein
MDVNLVLLTQDGKRKDFHLPSSVTVIGRRQDCDLCIPLMNVSRRHCEINQDEGKLRLRDLGSRNGTFVNGAKVKESELNDGDQIAIGPLEFKINLKSSSDNETSKEKKISTDFLKKEGYYSKSSSGSDTEIMEGFRQ